MSGNYLLDTNIVIGLFNSDKDILKQISKVKAVFIPSIVIGELYYGYHCSKQKKKNLKKLEEFIMYSSIIGIDTNTAKIYGLIKNQLKLKGTPIPENDLWIASIADQYNYILVSRDKHFKNISAITTKIW